MFDRPDLRNQNPWVIVDTKTFKVLKEGTFRELCSSTSGHLMTKSYYPQFLDEHK